MFMKSVALAYDKIFTVLGEPGMVKTADRMVRPYGTRLSSGGEVKAFIEGRIFKIIAGDMKRIWFLDGGITRYRDHIAYETIGMVLAGTPLGKQFQHEAWTLRFQGFEKDGSADVGGLAYDRGAFHQVINQYFDLMKYCKGARVDYAGDSSVQAAALLYFDLYCLDRYFPNYGDAGYCSSPARLRPTRQAVPSRQGLREDMVKAACEYAEFFRATGVKRFARIAWYLNGKKTDRIHLGILDRDPEKIQNAIRKVVDKADAPLEKSIIARNLGMCVLKSGEGKNRRAPWMRANRRNQIHEGGWHGHADSLNLGLFGYGLDLLPDVGYMDQKHWVFGHNTVSCQGTPLPHTGQRLPPGWADARLPLPVLSEAAFIDELAPGVQVARCVGTEHPDSMRTIFLVDAGKENFYVVDHFLVSASVPEKYVTYSFHTSQGKVSTNLALRKNKTSIEGTSRMKGKWLPPTFVASQKQAQQPWWAQVALEDTYKVLGKPSDVKVRFMPLRPADYVFHTNYMPQQVRSGMSDRLPYFFLTLARPKGRDKARQFSAIIEPYRRKRPVKSARVVETNQAGVEIIEVKEARGRTLTFVISDAPRKVTLADGTITKSDVTVIVKDRRKASVHKR